MDEKWENMRERQKKFADLLLDQEFDFEKRTWGSLEGESIILQLDGSEELLSIDFYLAGRTGFSLITKSDLEELRK